MMKRRGAEIMNWRRRRRWWWCWHCKLLFRGEVANNRRNKMLLLLLLEVVRESSRCAIRHDVGHARGPKKAEETGKEPEQPEERELGAGEANSGPITMLRGARGSEERGSNTVAIAAGYCNGCPPARLCFSFSPSKVDGYHGLLVVNAKVAF